MTPFILLQSIIFLFKMLSDAISDYEQKEQDAFNMGIVPSFKENRLKDQIMTVGEESDKLRSFGYLQ